MGQTRSIYLSKKQEVSVVREGVPWSVHKKGDESGRKKNGHIEGDSKE